MLNQYDTMIEKFKNIVRILKATCTHNTAIIIMNTDNPPLEGDSITVHDMKAVFKKIKRTKK